MFWSSIFQQEIQEGDLGSRIQCLQLARIKHKNDSSSDFASSKGKTFAMGQSNRGIL